MSARSRYLAAISPRSESCDDGNSINNNNFTSNSHSHESLTNSSNNFTSKQSMSPSSRYVKSAPVRNELPFSNVRSPSSVMARTQTHVSVSNQTNEAAATHHAPLRPPPPPPTGPPPKLGRKWGSAGVTQKKKDTNNCNADAAVTASGNITNDALGNSEKHFLSSRSYSSNKMTDAPKSIGTPLNAQFSNERQISLHSESPANSVKNPILYPLAQHHRQQQQQQQQQQQLKLQQPAKNIKDSTINSQLSPKTPSSSSSSAPLHENLTQSRGEQWAPHREIQSGNVAKYKNLIWGNTNKNMYNDDTHESVNNVNDNNVNGSVVGHGILGAAVSPNSATSISPTVWKKQLTTGMKQTNNNEDQSASTTSGKFTRNSADNNNNTKYTNKSSTSAGTKNLSTTNSSSVTSPLQQIHKQFPQRAPPTTPPRPVPSTLGSNASTFHATIDAGNSSITKKSIVTTTGRVTTRSPSPPKYKLNAPPPLEFSLHSNLSTHSNTPPRSNTTNAPKIVNDNGTARDQGPTTGGRFLGTASVNIAPPSRIIHQRSPNRRKLGMDTNSFTDQPVNAPSTTTSNGDRDGDIGIVQEQIQSRQIYTNGGNSNISLRQIRKLNIAPIETTFHITREDDDRNDDDEDVSYKEHAILQSEIQLNNELRIRDIREKHDNQYSTTDSTSLTADVSSSRMTTSNHRGDPWFDRAIKDDNGETNRVSQSNHTIRGDAAHSEEDTFDAAIVEVPSTIPKKVESRNINEMYSPKTTVASHTALSHQDVMMTSNLTLSGITTLTAFKRPQHKVGIIFTRHSRDAPDMAVISKVMPDSIFAGHDKNYQSIEGKGLEGAEVIAVNGIAVKDPRHAAELVAKAVEEVRLTLRRVVIDRGERTNNETVNREINKKISSNSMDSNLTGGLQEVGSKMGCAALHVDSQPLMTPDLDENEANHTIDFDEDSLLLIRENAQSIVSGTLDSLGHAEQAKSEGSRSERCHQQMTSTKSTKAQDIVERRRKVAQAMVMSAEMVNDPIPTSDLNIFEEFQTSDKYSTRHQDHGDRSPYDFEMNSSDDGEEEKFVEEIEESSSTSCPPLHPSVSPHQSNGGSVADKRRYAAMKIYNTQEMVPDNVNDVLLGTIDAVNLSFKDTITMTSPSFKNEPLCNVSVASFGDTASVARTDITTSSVVTQRMGSSPHNKEYIGSDEFSFPGSSAGSLSGGEDIFSQQSNLPSESPVAQRRKERARQRLRIAVSPTSSNASPPMAAERPMIPISPSAAPFSNKQMTKSANHNSKYSPVKANNKTDEESVTATSLEANSAASSSTFSEKSGESHSNVSLFRSLKKRHGLINRTEKQRLSTTSGTVVLKTPQQEKKKKPSLFGVANLIRKASSRKNKISKKGQLMEDISFFEDRDMQESSLSVKYSTLDFNTDSSLKIQSIRDQAVSPSKVDPQQKSTINVLSSTDRIHAGSLKDQSNRELAVTPVHYSPQKRTETNKPSPKKDTSSITSAIDNIPTTHKSDFDENIFFEDPFSSSPFNDPVNSRDAFGFLDQNVSQELTSALFDDGGTDPWGEPSSLKPVDFTPRRNNTLHSAKDHAFDNSDTVSYDASEMSEVTDPTFASSAIQNRPDPDEDDVSKNNIVKNPFGSTRKHQHNRRPGQGSSSQELSESEVPLVTLTNDFMKNGNSCFSMEGVDVSEAADGSESLKENFGTFDTKVSQSHGSEKKNNDSDDPPLASLETLDSSEDEQVVGDEENSIGVLSKQDSSSSMAKSRIMSKYVKNGKIRKPNRTDYKRKDSTGSQLVQNDSREGARSNSLVTLGKTPSNDSVDTSSKKKKAIPDNKRISILNEKSANDQFSNISATVVRDEIDGDYNKRRVSTTSNQYRTESEKNIQQKCQGAALKTTNASNNSAIIVSESELLSPIQRKDQLSSSIKENAITPVQKKGLIQERYIEDNILVAKNKRCQNDTKDQTYQRALPTKQEKSDYDQQSLLGTTKTNPNPILSTPVRQNSSPTNTSLVYRRKSGRSSPKSHEKSTGLLSPDRGTSNNRYSYNVKKKPIPSLIDNPNYYSIDHRLMKIKDPIQRAGVRLLWAAAIPIQTQARRYLARQHAIKRMCAILTIQAFVRRWLAGRDLEIAIWSVIQIQSVFRGWFARDSLEDNHYCATQIQRIVRGYLATMHVFEDLYSITIVQSVVRMHIAINVAIDRLTSIIAIQSWYRGVKTRYNLRERELSAIAIQATIRRYLCQMAYQFDIIDVIIVQSIARRQKAILVRKKLCAIKIQAAWRSYDCSMCYVHTIADIITVQSIVRKWYTLRYLASIRLQCLVRAFLSRKRYREEKALYVLLTRNVSATKIQAFWRSYSAQVQMLIAVVNIILIQSIWRRRSVMRLYKPLLIRMKLARERKVKKSAIKIQSAWRGFLAYAAYCEYKAAVRIQGAWRGFIAYSSYLIKRYEKQAAIIIQAYWRMYWQSTYYSIIYFEIIKIQAFVRGVQERSWQNFRRECATIIQASCRRFLTRKECHNDGMISILIAAASVSLRMRNATRQVQRWWMDELWRRKEKEAAIIIERFFIFVKKEVENEVKALKKKKKERRKLRKLKQSDDWILERAWLNTVEEPSVVADESVNSYQTYQHNDYSVGRKIYTKHDRFAPANILQSIEDDSQSEVSGLTDLSMGNRQVSRNLNKTMKDLEEDVSLEEAFHDSEIRQRQNNGKQYSRQYSISKYAATSKSQLRR